MNILITQSSVPDDADWDSIWAQSDHATFCHSRYWHQIWQKYTRGGISPCPVMLEFSDGKKAVIPLSVHSVAKGTIKRYLSSPATSYGGWFSVDPLTDQHHELILNHLNQKFPTLILRFNPLITFKPNGFAEYIKEDFTQIITFDGNFESQLKTWTKGHKSAVTKAGKAGVTTRLAQADSDWKNFYTMYLDFFERWGIKATSKYHPEFFQAIRTLNSNNAKLWLADYEGQSVGGAIIFYAKKHVMYGYSAALRKFFNLRAMNLLIHDVIKDANGRKYAWFDMCPSGGHNGVVSFKKSFGARKVSANILERQPGWLKIMEKVYKQWLLKFD